MIHASKQVVAMSSEPGGVARSKSVREPVEIHGDWQSLERHWQKVVGSERTLGSRSGGWLVRKEYSGDGLAPAAGEADEVAIYTERPGHSKTEIGRWPLGQVAEYEVDSDA